MRYYLTPPLGEESLAAYRGDPAYQVECYDARALLPQARVLFHVTARSGELEIAGAFGLPYVTVTYARGPHLEEAMAAQEARLASLG